MTLIGDSASHLCWYPEVTG